MQLHHYFGLSFFSGTPFQSTDWSFLSIMAQRSSWLQRWLHFPSSCCLWQLQDASSIGCQEEIARLLGPEMDHQLYSLGRLYLCWTTHHSHHVLHQKSFQCSCDFFDPLDVLLDLRNIKLGSASIRSDCNALIDTASSSRSWTTLLSRLHHVSICTGIHMRLPFGGSGVTSRKDDIFRILTHCDEMRKSTGSESTLTN